MYTVVYFFSGHSVYAWIVCHANMCICFSLKDLDNLKIDDVEASVASESCDELSDDVFTKALVLAKG